MPPRLRLFPPDTLARRGRPWPHRIDPVESGRCQAARGEALKLAPLTDAGSGSVQDKERARLVEIIDKVNELFAGELTESDRVLYYQVIKAKMLESTTLQEQAAHNTREQFASSPDLNEELIHAVIDVSEAQQSMSAQVLSSQGTQQALLELLLSDPDFYARLRALRA